MTSTARLSSAEAEASRLVAKANARMSRIENSARDEPRPGYERNVYGSFYGTAALDEALSILSQAERIHPLEGATLYLRAGILASAGRLAESAVAYEHVISSFPSYAHVSMSQLAWVYGLMGKLEQTRALIGRYNDEVIKTNVPLPLLTIEKLNLESFL